MVPTHSQTWSNLCECWLGGSCSGSINKHCLSSRTSNRAGPPGGTRGEVSPKDVVFNNVPIYIWRAPVLAIIVSVSFIYFYCFYFYNTVFHSPRHTGSNLHSRVSSRGCNNRSCCNANTKDFNDGSKWRGRTAFRFVGFRRGRTGTAGGKRLNKFTKQNGERQRVKTTSHLTDGPLALARTHLCAESIYISTPHKVLHWLLMSFSPTIIRTLIEQSASYICCYASLNFNFEVKMPRNNKYSKLVV